MTNDIKTRDTREIIIIVAMLGGVIIWASTVFLRQTSIMQYSIIRSLLGVAPNFGAVLGAFGLAYTTVFPVVLKRKFDFAYSVPLMFILLALLLASEIIHDLFLNEPFDVWDMVASIIAAVLLWGLLNSTKSP